MCRRVVWLIVVITAAACGDPPVSPSSPGSVVTSIRIEGPASMPPGTSVQLRLIATFADGRTADIASEAAWFTSNASVVSFPSRGLAVAKDRGEAAIGAQYQRHVPQFRLFVLEDGTFRVSGRITESGAGLPGARVDVVAGTGAGQSAITGSSGTYALYGIAGDVQLDVMLDGFARERRTIAVNAHSTVDLELVPLVEPSDLRGDWHLTLSAAPDCPPSFPRDAATRSYLVTIEQSGTVLQVQVKSPPIIDSDMQVSGRVVNRTVTMALPMDDFYYPFYGIRFYALVESLGNRFLAIAGTGRGDRVGNEVAGAFDGEFALYRNHDFGSVRNQDISCHSRAHSFRLER